MPNLAFSEASEAQQQRPLRQFKLEDQAAHAQQQGPVRTVLMGNGYPLLDPSTLRAALPAMERQGVSRVARSSVGFATAYLAGRDLERPRAPGLQETWKQRRDNFVRRHLAQVEKRGEPLWTPMGAPTRRHLALIAWAYSPDPGRLQTWLLQQPRR